MGKRENAGNQHLFFLPPCFLPYHRRRKKHFSNIKFVIFKCFQFSKCQDFVVWQGVNHLYFCASIPLQIVSSHIIARVPIHAFLKYLLPIIASTFFSTNWLHKQISYFAEMKSPAKMDFLKETFQILTLAFTAIDLQQF